MKIQGSVSVILDAVDIEQAELKSGSNKGTSHKIFIIMAAAYAHEDIIKIKKFCDRVKHLLILETTNPLDTDHTLVNFAIRPKTAEEIIAEDCGLSA